MEIAEILTLLIVALGGWVLWGNLKTREIANGAIRAMCNAHGLLFLNDTVALESLWPVRDDEGRLRLRRVYSFEYSDTGHDRRKGSVTLIAETVDALDGGPPPPSMPEGEAGR